MQTQICYPDLSGVYNWNKGYDYQLRQPISEEDLLDTYAPKTQLALGSMVQNGMDAFEKPLKEKGWIQLGWYPSLHGRYSTIYPVYVVAKIQPDSPLIDPTSSGVPTLGCSVSFLQGPNPVVRRCSDYGYSCFTWERDQKLFTIWRWLHSYGRPVEAFNRLGFRKFATTTLASYWCWGLKPGELR
jgi:hypothetical protein